MKHLGRREFIAASVAGMAGAGLSGSSRPAEAAATKRMNILFLMSDQHRGDYVGCNGADWLETPHLDRLAREGITFQRAYCSLPSCYPARASLLTGMSPWNHGLLLFSRLAPRYENEKPRMLRHAGYRTHAIGKLHFDGDDHGFETLALSEPWLWKDGQGIKCAYRRWFEKNCPDKNITLASSGSVDHRGGRPYPYGEDLHPTVWTRREAVDFLEHYHGDRPWFLKVAFHRPHPPFDPPQRLMERYEAKELPDPPVGKWAEEKYGSFQGSVETTPNAPRGNYPKEDIHRSRAAYGAAITHIDEQIGYILEALERRGELENTLILYTSDHGDMMGDQHLWRKTYAYEGSARVPMIMRWPEALQGATEAERGRVLDHLVELRDVAPTFLAAAGIDQPDTMDGCSLLDIVRGEAQDWRTQLDLEHGQCYWEENAWVALTDARYKYIYFTRTGEQQLFDLKNDPHECSDLSHSDAHAALLGRWRARMVQHLRVRGEPWVREGDLGTFKDIIRYGPNHPPMKGLV